MSRRAFITGITGQDGRHLAEFLHSKGYEVFGMIKGQHNPRAEILRDEMPYVTAVPGDLADLPSLVKAYEVAQPDEVYNLGAISFVAMSFNQPELTANITGLGVLRMLEAMRMVGGADRNPIRFYQASSSEMFGKVRETPQNEDTPFHPRSPYGCAKVFGHNIVLNYRESYGLFACSGILFNHEGPRRGLEFVTRKITNAVARIKLGIQSELVLGTLESKRDWGYAGDFVRGDVVDAPAGRAAGLRRRHRRDPLGRRVRRARLRRGGHRRLATLRAPRRTLPAPGRGRSADRRRVAGSRDARLGARPSRSTSSSR